MRSTFLYTLASILSLVVGVSGYQVSSPELGRRKWLSTVPGAATAAAFGLSVSGDASSRAFAAETTSSTKLSTFNDPLHGFSIGVPDGWISSEQKLPDRRTMLLWNDPTDPKSFIFVAYTPVRDDYTSIGSFGSVDQVAAYTILPKGKISGFDIEATMLETASKKSAYFFDYKQLVPDVQPETHMRTIFTLQQGATGGAGAVLVTITAQTSEERYQGGLKPLFDQVIDSYGKSV